MSHRLDQRHRMKGATLQGPRGAQWIACARCGGQVPFDKRERQARCPYCDAALRRPRLTRLMRILLTLLAFLATAVLLAHLTAR
jgi:DNA-directed RNA polymerase subunit RPC12/RpoP